MSHSGTKYQNLSRCVDRKRPERSIQKSPVGTLNCAFTQPTWSFWHPLHGVATHGIRDYYAMAHLLQLINAIWIQGISTASATTNELNGRPSRVSERLAKTSRLEGGNAVESWNETTERVKEVTESKAPLSGSANSIPRTTHTTIKALSQSHAQLSSTFPATRLSSLLTKPKRVFQRPNALMLLTWNQTMHRRCVWEGLTKSTTQDKS